MTTADLLKVAGFIRCELPAAKKLFEVQYDDPETGERVTVNEWFDDSPEFPAKEWANDFGYARADKGWYRVRELNPSA